MASSSPPPVPLTGDPAGEDIALQRHWRKRVHLSSLGDAAQAMVVRAGFHRASWLAVAFASGIALWLVLDGPRQWVAAGASALGLAMLALVVPDRQHARAQLRQAIAALALALLAGMCIIWARSAVTGAEPIARPMSVILDGRILDRIEQPAQDRVRLVMAVRLPDDQRAARVRLNLPEAEDQAGIRPGAVIRVRARLMPPAPPMLPGAYDFARAAWFRGLAATGSVQGPVTVLSAGTDADRIGRLQAALSSHVQARLGGSPGSIAAALASGDRGAIAQRDEDAMRDAGLTHLLSISGLHVSAVIAAAYVLAMRLLALWPWLALRVRLPVLAAGIGALAGVGYTLLTGAEVPTVRSCVGAGLVLLALALGREALSMRMVALAALFVLLLWPESLYGPSFQMSFAAVIAIVALHQSTAVRAFLAPRGEGWLGHAARRVVMLFVTGLVIELALMPIGLFHFHRAGVYGAFANVLAIPLTTFVSMPLIALALLLDTFGAGAPAWWLVGKSLELLLAIAHWTASQPGSVKTLPSMSGWIFALFICGGVWLALWQGRERLFGLVPIILASLAAWLTPAPDVLVSGDGRNVAIAGEGGRLLVLRDSKSNFTRDNLQELSGISSDPIPLDRWPGASCSADFCAITLQRAGRDWHLLMARSRTRIAERNLAAACERADIVVADRRLPSSCRPRWVKADRRMLERSGGLAITLASQRIRSVAEDQGHHGWWRGARDERRTSRASVQ
ncbi:MAG: ComEC/Rec2 family competence protein [Novosphingobium sp.]